MRWQRLIVVGLISAVAVAGLLASSWTVAGTTELPRTPGPPVFSPQSSAPRVGSYSANWNEHDAAPGELIVGFASSAAGASDREATITAAGASLERHLLVPGYSLILVQAGAESEYAESLLAEPGVVSVEPNLIRRALFEPNDEVYPFQWHFPQIGLPTAWDKTMGVGVTVAVIDSGIAYEGCLAAVCGDDYTKAPDFAGTSFVSPWDFVDGDAHANDVTGHGTHVASTIAEATNNTIGGAGAAPAVSLMPIRTSNIAEESEGLQWAADQGADIINMSLGGPQTSPIQEAAVSYAQNQGALVVAAVGNGGEDEVGDPEIYCPACYPGVVAVGATRFDQTRVSYSNYGDSPPGINHGLVLMGPGGDGTVDQNGDTFSDQVIQQTFTHACPGGGPVNFAAFSYCGKVGTSMATPHVAGVAALVLSVNPNLSPVGVWNILTTTATDLGALGYDEQYGFGEVNAAAAVVAAQETLLTPSPVPTATPVPTSTPALSQTSIVVLKQDADGNQPLQGWEFNLFDADCFSLPGPGFPRSGTTAGDGTITFSGLAPGLYSIDETQQDGWNVVPPENFCQEVTVPVQGVVIFVNQRKVTPTATATTTTAPMPTATPTPTRTATLTPTRTATLTPTATRTATPSVLLGDVSCDGILDSIDPLLILQLLADFLQSLACESAGDVDLNGTIDSLDALIILQFLAGLISRLPP